MPFFRYQARDATGVFVEGTIEAGDPREAQRRLQDRGITTHSLVGMPRAASQQAGPFVINVPKGPSSNLSGHPIRKTRWGSDKDRFFLFTQLASHLKAGTNPAQAFGMLSKNTVRADYREALEAASRCGMEGRSVAEVLRQYPYLFPAHVAGIYAAGERGGFLPEACEAIAGQAESARKFGRPFIWLGALTLMTLICAPLGLWVVKSGLATMELQEKAGGSLPRFETFYQALADQMKWPFGPVLVGLGVLGAVIWCWWRSLRRTLNRHALTLRLPIAGKRGWSEGVAVFSWTLSHLLKAAVPPRAAVLGAAEAIPNRAVRQELNGIGEGMKDNTSLSAALGASPRLPAEFKPLLATGEMTGDVPGQLLIVARASRDEQMEIEGASKVRIGCWAVLLMALGFVFVAWLLYGYMYPEIIKAFEAEA